MSDDHSKIDSLLNLFGLSGYYQKYEIKSKTKFTYTEGTSLETFQKFKIMNDSAP